MQLEVSEANAGRHSSTQPGFGAEPGADPVRKMAQCRPKNSLFSRLPAGR
jgi:hypothetical protein